VDAIPKVTGEGKYAADFILPGMLWGKMLRSPFPHAKILNIDTSKAERLPGVRAVITGKDFGEFKYGNMPSTRDETPLAVDKVLFIGDEVAAVAAIDEDIAEEAVELIQVEYEELPAVTDPIEAMKEGAPQIHAHAERNIAGKISLNFGDVEKGFKESDYIREDRFETPRVFPGYLEPHGTLAKYDSSGKITIWSSAQTPYFVHRNLSLAFGVPLSKVRVVQPYIGGGFGGKNYCFPLNFCAAMLSRKTGKPVKIVYSQKEVLLSSPRRSNMIFEMKTGVKNDGTLVARQCKAFSDSGAHALIGVATMWLTGTMLALPYRLPNLKYEGYRIYTNKPPCCAQRGHGGAQSNFAGEVQLDIIAQDLGLDPVEIRLKNAMEAGYTAVNGIKITSCGLSECIKQAAETVDWKNRWKKKEDNGEISRGIGFAASGYVSGMRLPGHSACAVGVRVHLDGTIGIISGATDCGQGSDTMLAQVVAEVLGVPMEDVNVGLPDTELTPLDPGTYSSRVTTWAGTAAKLAAEDAKRQLAEVAAGLLQANVEDIEFKDRKVFVKGNPEKELTLRALARIASAAGGGNVIWGRGVFGFDIDAAFMDTGIGNPSPSYSFAASVAEVEVDRLTGQVKLVDTTVAHDCGVMLNPLAVEGQADGQVAMGCGQTLTEQFIMEGAKTLNPSLTDYKMPRALDMPKIRSIPVETIDPMGPFGAKEASEAIIVTTYPSIVSAIHNAVGVWIKDLPVTAEKVLKALNEKEKS